jgi:hypothetical protein
MPMLPWKNSRRFLARLLRWGLTRPLTRDTETAGRVSQPGWAGSRTKADRIAHRAK